MYNKKTINKIRMIINKPPTFPSKNTLSPFLKLAIVVARRINGRVFHMSTILLKN